jgi:hypothetical protein
MAPRVRLQTLTRNERLTGRLRPKVKRNVVFTDFGPRDGTANVGLEVEMVRETARAHMPAKPAEADWKQERYWREATPNDLSDATLGWFINHAAEALPEASQNESAAMHL